MSAYNIFWKERLVLADEYYASFISDRPEKSSVDLDKLEYKHVKSVCSLPNK